MSNIRSWIRDSKGDGETGSGYQAQKSRQWGFSLRWFALFLLVSLVVGAYIYRDGAARWSSHGWLQQSALSWPKLSGVRLGLQRVQLADMQFSVQMATGLASVQLHALNAAYDLSTAELASIQVANARVRFTYSAGAEAPGSKSTSSSANDAEKASLELPVKHISIETLDIEISMEQGVFAFMGGVELFYDQDDGLRAVLQQDVKQIILEISPDLRVAKLSIQESADSQIGQVQYRQTDQAHYQVELDADALPLLNWLTSTTLIPEKFRSDLLTSSFFQISPELAAVKLNLKAGSNDGFKNIQGRMLLTRQQRYLASSGFSFNRAKSRLGVDGHVDMTMAEALALAKPWLPEKAELWQEPTGNLVGTFRYNSLLDDKLDGQVYLRAYEFGGTIGPLTVQNGFVRLDVEQGATLNTVLEVDLPALQLGKETEVRNIQVKVGHKDNMVTVEKASVPIFGGVLQILPASVNIGQMPIDLTVGVNNLDLAQLLASLNYPELSGTGTISGKLPLRLATDSFEVRDGVLNGTHPGVLRYQGPVSDGSNIAFSALRNLRYHTLQGTLNYLPDGDYQLGLRLEGKNPELLSGHPVAFNLNLSGHVPELLQKGLLAGDFDKPILEQIKTEGEHWNR